MGVYIGQSTKIYDRATGTVTYGRIPAGFGRGLGQPAQRRRQVQPVLRAVIVKRVDAQTRAKTSLNDLLRD
jgi:2,3,4,5-tetrahydropyridine-2-carboxylate N-succinyltransferase